MIIHEERCFFLEEFANTDASFEETEHRRLSDSAAAKPIRQRLKRQGTTDAVPLVEFHDALSQSTAFGSDVEQRT